MGFVNSVVLILYEKLSPQREQIWDSLVNVSVHTHTHTHIYA